jgi:hypothetical protein
LVKEGGKKERREGEWEKQKGRREGRMGEGKKRRKKESGSRSARFSDPLQALPILAVTWPTLAEEGTG